MSSSEAKKRILVKHKDEVWKYGEYWLGAQKRNFCFRQVALNTLSYRTKLKLKEHHITWDLATGKCHQSFKTEDGTALSIYRNGLKIESKEDGFGQSLDLVVAQRQLLEHLQKMVKGFEGLRAGQLLQLHSSNTPSGFLKSFSTQVKGELRKTDVLLENDEVIMSIFVTTRDHKFRKFFDEDSLTIIDEIYFPLKETDRQSAQGCIILVLHK